MDVVARARTVWGKKNWTFCTCENSTWIPNSAVLQGSYSLATLPCKRERALLSPAIYSKVYRRCARAKIAFAVWLIHFPRFVTNVRLQSKHVATIQSGFIAIPMHNALSRTARAKPIMAALPGPVGFNEWRAKRGCRPI